MTEAYHLTRGRMSNDAQVVVVGCGGTGGFVAEGLCRLFGDQDARILLVDHDRVEEHNLRRQNFYAGDVGRFKSEALAERLARIYGREVWYSVYPFSIESFTETFATRRFTRSMSGLIIGCVDNAAARRHIADSATGWDWWLDSGNGEHSGQVLIGNAKDSESLAGGFDGDNMEVHRLPLPTVQEPALLVPVTEPDTPDLDCAEAVDANLQSPIINQQMATLVLEFVSRFYAGTLSWMAAYIDLEMGTLRPVPAAPKIVAKMVGVRVDSLVSKRAKQGKGPAPCCPSCGRRHW